MAATNTGIEWGEDKAKERLEALFEKDNLWPAVLAARAALREFPLVDIESSWAAAYVDRPWLILGSKGSIYEKNNTIVIKYFSPKNNKFVKRDKYSYLSNELIHWKLKKYKFIKEEIDNYGAQKFYTNLYNHFYRKKRNPAAINSAKKTLKFIDNYLK